MRLSAHRIRSINRSIARVNGIICGASDKTHRAAPENQKPVTPVSCSNCGEPVLSHHVCRHCGVYRGREMAPAQE